MLTEESVWYCFSMKWKIHSILFCKFLFLDPWPFSAWGTVLLTVYWLQIKQLKDDFSELGPEWDRLTLHISLHGITNLQSVWPVLGSDPKASHSVSYPSLHGLPGVSLQSTLSTSSTARLMKTFC